MVTPYLYYGFGIAKAKPRIGRPPRQALTGVPKRQLEQLYYKDNNFFGREKLYQLARSRGIKASRRQIEDWLRRQQVHQLYFPTMKTKTIRLSPQKEPFGQVAVDLIDMTNFESANGYKWIFNAIDLFTKKAYAIPMKDKTGESSVAALKELLRQPGFKKMKSIRSDRGSEFVDERFQSVLKKKHIKQVFSSADTPQSNGQIENFNRTLKGLIRKYIATTDNDDWVSVLKQLVNNYNNTVHFTTKKTPNELAQPIDAQDKKHIYEKLRKAAKQRSQLTSMKPKFVAGDEVRIKQDLEDRPRLAFTFSRDIYVIDKVFVPRNDLTAVSYRLRTLDGEILPERYYNEDLQKVNPVEREIRVPVTYEISKIIEPVFLDGNKAFRIAWKGYRGKKNQTLEPRSQLVKDAPRIVSNFERENDIDWNAVDRYTTGDD
jgi:transposase InsO family protein